MKFIEDNRWPPAVDKVRAKSFLWRQLVCLVFISIASSSDETLHHNCYTLKCVYGYAYVYVYLIRGLVPFV